MAYKEVGPWQLIRDFFFNRVKWRTRISRSEYVTYDAILAEHSEFYRGLSSDMRAKTMHRVLAFIDQKEFVGHGIEITDKVKLMIGFAAVKLTFGFKRYLIPHLHTINVATKSFYAPMIKNHVKGLTSENGTMYLSWKDVMEGAEIESDGLHLAVHEMAHALKIDTVKGSPAKERFAFYLNTWLKEAKERKMKTDYSFLRSYAKVNMHEFFAVCMENFIERPSGFYKAEPVLFAHTCYLLNQFPLEPKNRALTPSAITSLAKRTGVRFPKLSDKDYSHHSWHWSFSLLMISLFVSPILIGALTSDVSLPINGWTMWLLSCLLAAALFYKPVVGYKAMTVSMFIPFLLLGAGPAVYSAALLADALVPLKTWSDSYEIALAYPDLFDNSTKIEIENEKLKDWPEARTFPIAYMQDLRKDSSAVLVVTFRQGILGITRLTDHRLVFDRTGLELPAQTN